MLLAMADVPGEIFLDRHSSAWLGPSVGSRPAVLVQGPQEIRPAGVGSFQDRQTRIEQMCLSGILESSPGFVVVGLDLRVHLGQSPPHPCQARGVHIGQMVDHLSRSPAADLRFRRNRGHVQAQNGGKSFQACQ